MKVKINPSAIPAISNDAMQFHNGQNRPNPKSFVLERTNFMT